jgi:transposase-like protein
VYRFVAKGIMFTSFINIRNSFYSVPKSFLENSRISPIFKSRHSSGFYINTMVLVGWFMVFNATFNNISVIYFIDGGNQSTRRKPPTCGKSLPNLSFYSVPKSFLENSRISPIFKSRHSSGFYIKL